MAESWTGADRAEAVREADRLGYPVLVNGERCETKVAAMEAIQAAEGEMVVERA